MTPESPQLLAIPRPPLRSSRCCGACGVGGRARQPRPFEVHQDRIAYRSRTADRTSTASAETSRAPQARGLPILLCAVLASLRAVLVPRARSAARSAALIARAAAANFRQRAAQT